MPTWFVKLKKIIHLRLAVVHNSQLPLIQFKKFHNEDGRFASWMGFPSTLPFHTSFFDSDHGQINGMVASLVWQGMASVRKHRLVFIPILTIILNLLRLKEQTESYGRLFIPRWDPGGERETITYLSCSQLLIPFLLPFFLLPLLLSSFKRLSPCKTYPTYRTLPAISGIKSSTFCVQLNSKLCNCKPFKSLLLCKHIFCNNTFNVPRSFLFLHDSSKVKRWVVGLGCKLGVVASCFSWANTLPNLTLGAG